jgi:hypothetical protein
MKRSTIRGTVGRSVLSVLVLASGLLAGAMPSARADSGNPPPFDFTDEFYRLNGVNPALLEGRPNGADGISVVDDAPDANHRGIRMVLTIPAYDTSGGIHYFTVLSNLQPGAFTANAAGTKARQLAEKSELYVFPVKGGDPTSVGNSRQESMIDLSNGYFSNNPLALWVHVFVNWTARAFNTAQGRAALADLAGKNGLALDGTPIINNKSQIDDLLKKRLVTLRKRPTTETGRWFICPVIEDPRDGAIAKDAFLAFVADENGNPLPAEQDFLTNFESLQLTGEWAN